ncbi:hypothetical protein [uncultured Lamprocystis sp.]|jgi:hypothetical protein|uniref:hypothetical protein n=1 Tax=uncultured Lamprocystis sp. TaxID=543132 RepID=UPI0025F93CAD|nr:hypothetical protein [uncultured Lamprocystis sp.]
MEDDLHIAEFKLRLKPADADLLRALARKRDVPPAVMVRAIVIAALAPAGYSVPAAPENRRPV